MSANRSNRKKRLTVEQLEARRLLAGLWSYVDNSAVPADLPSLIRINDFKIATLDSPAIRDQLSNAPAELTHPALESSILSIPKPDGKMERFSIFASSIMEPELAARFPEIQTYAGQGIDNPASTIQLDMTPQGFHAQVISPSGTYYVDPYSNITSDFYAVYSKGTAKVDTGFREFEADLPGLKGDGSSNGNVVSNGGSVQSRSGTHLRTYRLAVAATGEYTQFHGGTVALGQAAIVTAINRVGGIYQTELSIAFKLVANNDKLVFTDPASDGYSNNNGGAMLGENQAKVDSIIGNANYDIGHVFSTGGGGVALLGSVGVNSIKAQGVTGLPTPIADAFYVDYVAHEMGHQFGGNHTFNSTAGSCGGGNRNTSTAYEPGSGVTIQAYAGICGADDLQPNSDPYFHSASLDEIVRHVDTVIPNVGTRTVTGNNIPIINAGVDYVIPARTPFVLTAIGSDADATDTLTFDWQQRDLGPAQALTAADNGTSPLFRTWVPTTTPSRTFPRLSDLVNNTIAKGERLPTTTRQLNFRVVARDNRAIGGAFDDDNMRISVIDTGTPFAVTTPNTNVSWEGLTFQTIEWNVAGTTANGINAALVDISVSTDGGLTYPFVAATSAPNNGSAIVRIPNTPTTRARVRVQASSGIFFDISDANFAITPATKTIDINLGPSVTFVENSLAIPIAPAAKVTETNVSGYAGASLTLTIASDFQAGDSLDIINQGTGSGEISVSGNQILLAGAFIGNYSGPGQTLNVTLNAAANGASIEKLLSAVSFTHTTDDPSPNARSITAYLDNGLNGASNKATVLVSVTPVNDAPRSNNAVLASIVEDIVNPAGTTILALVGPTFQDPDRGSSLSGIAITSNSASVSTGVWQYSVNGVTWLPVGNVAPATSLALSSSTRIRFLPGKDFFGTPTALVYRALDDSNTSGFSTAIRQFVDVSTATNIGPIALVGASIGIQVTPVNDAPITNVPSQIFSVNQDDLFSLPIPAGWFTDVDNTNLKLSFSPAAGAIPPTWLSLDQATRRLVGTPANEDVGVYDLILRATDAAGLFTVLQVQVSVINLNDAPTNIELIGNSVKENETGVFIGTLFVTDKDSSDQFTWLVLDQRFAVIGNVLYLAAGAKLDYEASPQVDIQIRVTDSGTPPLSLTLTKTINVIDINEFAPSFRPTQYDVSESAIGGTQIGFLASSDGDLSNTIRYRITGTPQTIFAVDSNTGRISLLPGVSLDHELIASYQFFVEASDNGLPSLSTTSSVNINVTDVNEFAPVVTTGSISMSERQAIGIPFTTIAAFDRDTRQSIQFSLLSTETRFTINPNNGDLSLNRSGLFDFETKPVDSLVIVTVDSGTPQFRTETSVAILVQDANDPPTAATVSNPNLLSNISELSLGKIAIADQDVGQQYIVVSGDDRFTIVDDNLVLASGKAIGDSDPLQFSVPVIVTEIGADSRSYNLNVNINRIPNQSPWQNRLNRLDVNRIDGVNPLDALTIINALNGNEFSRLPFPRPASSLSLPDYDVDGDGTINPLDVLAIINFLNNKSSGEGEAKSSPLSSDPVHVELDDATWLAAYSQIEEERTATRRRRV